MLRNWAGFSGREETTLLLWAYQAIVGLIALLVAAAVLRERSAGRQAGGAIVLAVLLLRLFMVK